MGFSLVCEFLGGYEATRVPGAEIAAAGLLKGP